MAKNTTKKTESEIVEEPIITEDVAVVKDTDKKVSKKAAASAKKYAPTDTIECRNVVGGKLILIGSKSHLKYTWEDYGDTAWVEYQDLQALQSRKSKFLTKPRFIIEDDDLVEQWGTMLKPIYNKITDQTIEEFFELPLNKFKARLSIVPDGLKSAIKTKAVQMIKSEELYDIRKVRVIDEVLGTDFVEMFLK
jgi:hypothetical protein